MKKLILLYVIWSALYFTHNAYTNTAWFGVTWDQYAENTLSISDFIYYGQRISEPLWFLPALLYSISLVAVSIKYKLLKTLVVVGFILNVVGLFGSFQELWFVFDQPIITRDALFFGLLYTSLGAFLAENNRYREIGKSGRFWLILSMLFLILTMVEKASLGKISGWMNAGDYYLFTIPLIFSLFMAAVKAPNFGKYSILTKLGQGALGVYLMHSLLKAWAAFYLPKYLGEDFWQRLPYLLTIVPALFLLSWFFYYTVPGLAKKLFTRDRFSN